VEQTEIVTFRNHI